MSDLGSGSLGFEVRAHRYGSRAWPALVCRLPPGLRAISSAPCGGGLGERRWVLNAQVPSGYSRRDPAAHLTDIASGLGLRGNGVGMLTAADLSDARSAREGGVVVVATVGTDSVQPAAGKSVFEPGRVGTINLAILVPGAMSDAALVNAVATATEAKSQALAEAGFDGTGTPTDALCILCPTEGRVGTFGGPRSKWGSRIAIAVHRAVLQGAYA